MRLVGRFEALCDCFRDSADVRTSGTRFDLTTTQFVQTSAQGAMSAENFRHGFRHLRHEATEMLSVWVFVDFRIISASRRGVGFAPSQNYCRLNLQMTSHRPAMRFHR
jgi:hypothetical protein